MEVYVKRITLKSDSDAIVKSKWRIQTVELDILASQKDKWMYYKANITTENLKEQAKLTDITYEAAKSSLTSQNESDNVYFEIDEKRSSLNVIKKLDPEQDIEIVYLKIPLQQLNVHKDAIQVMITQISDVEAVCKQLCEKEAVAKMYEKHLEEIITRYEKLVEGKSQLEENNVNFLHLINAKKQFIKDAKLDCSSKFDQSSEDQKADLKPSTSHQAVTPTRYKSVLQSPMKSKKRTPSKKLFDQINQAPSDSDDSFNIIPCKSDKNNSRTIFKDLKVTTPKKNKEEARESSLERKIRITDDDSPILFNSDDSELNISSTSIENAQNIVNETAIVDKFSDDEEMIPSSQNLTEVEVYSESFLKRKKQKQAATKLAKKQKTDDPYAKETVNIFDNSD